MATTLLSNKKSTTGSPYAFYTVTGEEVSRTASSVKVKITVTWNLQYSESWVGTGFSLEGYIYLGGSWRNITLKPSATSISGTATRTATGTFAVSASASATSLTGIYFKVETSNSNYPGTELTSTACNNMPISIGAQKSSLGSISNANVGDTITVKLTQNTSGSTDYLYYRTYKNGAWSSWTKFATLTSSQSYSWTVPTAIADAMLATSKTITCQIASDTYNNGTYIGTPSTNEFTVTLPSSLGAPTGLALGTPTINGKTATIAITAPSYKYGASLSKYNVTTSAGTASVSGNTATITFSSQVSSNVTVSVTATDSRGFTSNSASKTLSPVALSTKTLSLSQTSYTYDGTAKQPTPSISGLTLNTGYTIAYSNNTNAGTATATATGLGLYTGTVSKTFTINKRTITDRTLTVSPSTYIYDGTAKQPTPSIEGLTLGTDYTVQYSNNTNVGIATVEATGKGNYKDNLTTTFEILDKSLPTVLTLLFNRIIPISKGGTGATSSTAAVANLKSNMVDVLYPVGSIYMSVNSTNPSTLFGGTWAQLKDRFLLSAGNSYTAGSKDGAATVALSASTMPAHTHTFTGSSATSKNSSPSTHTHAVSGGAGTNQSSGGDARVNSYASLYSSYRNISTAGASGGAHTHTATAKGSNSNTGEGSAHDNMPPYLVVYMWERTA